MNIQETELDSAINKPVKLSPYLIVGENWLRKDNQMIEQQQKLLKCHYVETVPFLIALLSRG